MNEHMGALSPITLTTDATEIEWSTACPKGEIVLVTEDQYATVVLPDGREVIVTGCGTVVDGN